MSDMPETIYAGTIVTADRDSFPIWGPDPDDDCTTYLRADMVEQRIADACQQEADSRNRAYRERNQCVAAISKVFPSYLAKHRDTGEGWDPEWCNVVYVVGPAGQMGWHIHTSDLDLFSHLEWRENDWDGHNTDEKYRRLAAIDPGELRRCRAETLREAADRIDGLEYPTPAPTAVVANAYDEQCLQIQDHLRRMAEEEQP